jgi:hypothetical protein
MIQFLVPSMGHSHLSLALVHCCNELTRRGREVRVFVQDRGTPPVRPIFPIFDAAYAYLAPEPMVVVGVSPLRTSFLSPTGRPVLFYAWDLEWTRKERFSWNDMRGYYQTYPVIARSASHSRILTHTWGAKVVGVIPDFEPDEMEKALCSLMNIS